MGTADRGAVLILAFLALFPACEELTADRLIAIPAAEFTDGRDWPPSLPLYLKAGGGNINGINRRLQELQLDTDPVHVGSASCHHGPPITSPVFLEARAFYTGSEIGVEVRWEDPTEDTAPKAWVRTADGWALGEGDQDGIAILWSRTGGTFGCQEACHMSDFSLRAGELIDLRAMFLEKEGDWEEAWVWKPSEGAQALLLGKDGFVSHDSGRAYRTLNSAVAADSSLRPEARRAGTFGPGDRPLYGEGGTPPDTGDLKAPAYLFSGKKGGGGLVSFAERTGEGWGVVFRRALDAGEGRQAFRPGGRYRFGLAVFDATSTDHHLVRDTQLLELFVPPEAPPPAGEGGDDPGDGHRDEGGIF